MDIQDFLNQYDTNYTNAKQGVEKNSIWLFYLGSLRIQWALE